SYTYKHPTSNTPHQTPHIKHPTSNTPHQTPHIKHLSPSKNHFICLKVKLILGSVTFFVEAILCNQCFCVSPFISINEPFASSKSFLSPDCLCLKSNLR